MTDRIPETELAEWERVCEAATNGPWVFDGVLHQPLINKKYPEGDVRWCQSLTFEHTDRKRPDGEFIATSRTALPRAIAALRAAYAREDAAIQMLDREHPLIQSAITTLRAQEPTR